MAHASVRAPVFPSDQCTVLENQEQAEDPFKEQESPIGLSGGVTDTVHTLYCIYSKRNNYWSGFCVLSEENVSTDLKSTLSFLPFSTAYLREPGFSS